MSGTASARELKTTEAGGAVKYALGFVCAVLGTMSFISVLTGGGGQALSFMLNATRGMGGKLYFIVPPLLLLWGAAFCASARRQVSFRALALLTGVYLCVCGVLTLVTSAEGYGSLMDFILTVNGRQRNEASPNSYAAFLSCAFDIRNYFSGTDQGGGWLGMLSAYPMWTALKTTGGALALGAVCIALIVLLFRVNVGGALQNAIERGDERRKTRRETKDEAPAPAPDAPPEWEPFTPPPRPQRTAPAGGQAVNYSRSYVSDAPVPADPQAPFYDDMPPERDDGFSPVKAGVLTPEHFPAPAREESAAKEESVSLWSDDIDASPAPQRRQAKQKQQEDDLPPWEEPKEQKRAEKPPRPASRKDAAPTPVYTDPAVELTGERIPVSAPRAKPAPAQGERLDGTPKVKIKQLQFEDAPKCDYTRPPVRLLSEPSAIGPRDTSREDEQSARRLEQTLSSFGVPSEVRQVLHGPAITRFALRLGEGVNVNRIGPLLNNIAMDMEARGSVRAEVIQGTSLVGIEVPNAHVDTVTLREVLDSEEMRGNPSPTAVALGKDITGSPVMCDLATLPHLLIAGATGSGKSVCINAIITSILYRAAPEQVRLILVDPKTVELQLYNGIPHLLAPVVTEPKKAAAALEWAVTEMQERYQKFKVKGVRNIHGYNDASPEERMPSIVLIIDELSDLMTVAKKSVEENIMRLTALARAAGIHLVVATQRPSVNVITGVIKANIPGRIAFAVASNVDSRTIIDGAGAEKLLGKGDMLFSPVSGNKPHRVQGCFISDGEVSRVVDYVKERCAPDFNPDFIEHLDGQDKESAESDNADDGEEISDELLMQAIEMAVESGQMSISMLQRRLKVGYARAGRLVDEMSRRGVISASEGSKPRRTLVTREDLKLHDDE